MDRRRFLNEPVSLEVYLYQKCGMRVILSDVDKKVPEWMTQAPAQKEGCT